MIEKVHRSAVPIIDKIEIATETFNSIKESFSDLPDFVNTDFEACISFLKAYDGSKATLSTYRGAVEKLLFWCWYIKKQSILDCRRSDIVEHIEFLKSPPINLIGTAVLPKFIKTSDGKKPNPKWRPFVAKVTKDQHRNNKTPNINKYAPTQETIKAAFAALGSMYGYFIDEDLIDQNPVKSIKQKSKYFSTGKSYKPVQRITNLQWDILVDCITMKALENPGRYARTKFLIILMLQTYARISDLVSVRSEPPPQMNDFFRDSADLWWVRFTGKGNKVREVGVSNALLDVLKEYRLHLGLSEYPHPSDNSPMLPSANGEAIKDEKTIRILVQEAFDITVIWMKENGYASVDYENLLHSSAHWLRHTAISEDIKHRPKEHVKEDAGHSSFLTTERYIESDRQERHQTSVAKGLTPND